MRTAVREPTLFESRLAELQQLLWNEPDAVDCLIIAHDDPAMIRKLTNASPGASVAVLPLPQMEWDACFTEILGLAEEFEIAHVIFAGHSTGAASSAAAENGTNRSGGRLMSRVHGMQQQLSASRRHFAQQIRRVTDMHTAETSLEALFFVAPSDLFLRFDPSSQSFVPLAERL